MLQHFTCSQSFLPKYIAEEVNIKKKEKLERQQKKTQEKEGKRRRKDEKKREKEAKKKEKEEEKKRKQLEKEKEQDSESEVGFCTDCRRACSEACHEAGLCECSGWCCYTACKTVFDCCRILGECLLCFTSV